MKNIYNLFVKGRKLAKKGRPLEAIMLLEQAKKHQPQKGSIREELARAYYNCSFYCSAKKEFKKALDIDAANDYAHYGLGLCLLKEGKFSNALGHFKIALAMKPNSKVYKESLSKYKMILKEK